VFPRDTRDADIELYDAGPAGAVPRPREQATVTYADDGARFTLTLPAAHDAPRVRGRKYRQGPPRR
jgi:hypothetical protein